MVEFLGSSTVSNVIQVMGLLLVWKYVDATIKLQRTSTAQLEAMSKPAIAVREDAAGHLFLVNAGNGSALEVSWVDSSKERFYVSILQVGGEHKLSFSFQDRQPLEIGGKTIFPRVEIQYRSLSGRKYVSRITFVHLHPMVEIIEVDSPEKYKWWERRTAAKSASA